MRLIDITQMLKDLEAMKSAYDAISLDGMIKALQDAPTVDAVPVVRCKDCEYNKIGSCEHSEQYDDLRYRPDYFCADGERRNE